MNKSLNIMLVDDDKGSLDALADALTISGFDVEPFMDPVKAIESYSAERYDVVVTDINMPEVSGIDLLDRVRRINPAACVIILTGFADIENAIAANNQGAYGFFRKPLDILRFLETLEKIEREQRQRKDANEEVSRFHELETDLDMTYQELQHYVVLLDQLQWVSRKIQGAESLKGILGELAGSAAHIINADFSFIAFKDNNESFCFGYSRSECRTTDYFQGGLPEREPFITWLSEKSNCLDNDPDTFLQGALKELDIEISNYLRLPLISHDRVIGALVVINRPGGFTSTDKFLVESLGHSAVSAITNSRLIADLEMLFEKILVVLSNAIEARDRYTGGHTNRVNAYSMKLGRRLGLSESQLKDLHIGTLLHDIGKIGIPDSVLNKPGGLTAEEYDLMKSHALIGEQMVKDIRQLAGVLPAIRNHHERYDGRGYPDGLRGEDIPVAGRIIAVADSFDAMTSTRSYRKALSAEIALTELQHCSGSQFDPVIVKAFIELYDQGDFRQVNPGLKTAGRNLREKVSA